jgi:hypothetical protein
MSLDEEDKKWILEQMGSLLNTSQESTNRVIGLVQTRMEGLVRNLELEMREGFDKVNRRFDQVNARLVRVDTVWKVARDWGRSSDEHDIQSDAVIANLARQVASLEERMSRIEHDKQ